MPVCHLYSVKEIEYTRRKPAVSRTNILYVVPYIFKKCLVDMKPESVLVVPVS